MRGLPVIGLAAALVAVSVAACDDASSRAGGVTPQVPAPTVTSGTPSATAPPEGPTGPEGQSATLRANDYEPSLFDESSTTIDNQWFPLQPGAQYVYRGSTLEGRERVYHRVVFTVTDLTKVVDGVRTLVAWDRDYSGGELVETELAMFAQDTAGNVWHFGQYPEEYEDGRFVKAPAWVAGFEGARTGITIKAEPQQGSPSYSQGFAPPPINWDDRARVYQTEQSTCVPYGCFDGVLITEEFEPSKPGAFQLKFYAPGVGNVRVGWRGRNEKEQERLVLIDVIRLNADAMDEVRTDALALDENGYTRAEGSWGQIPPAEPLAD